MSSNIEGTPSDATNKLREVSKAVSMSTTIKISEEDKPSKEPALLAKQEVKKEQNTGEIQDDIIYDGDGKESKEIKRENLDYSGTSEYIEDETGFEDMSYPAMEIDESIGYGFEGYVHPIHYTDVIEDDLNDIDEDSKDDDPDFGQKKKKKKKESINVLLRGEDPTKNRRIAKPKILECTDDLTKIDHCEDNPNFAVVVDFIEKFGEHLGMKRIPIKELQSMLSDHENEPHTDLIKLHTNLLRKTKLPKKTLITKKTWENALILFCHTTGGIVGEGLELQKLGYAQISLSLRLEILKNLMESQFDWNERIRMLVDDLPVEALRNEPTGKDIEGKIYWTQIDDHAEIRIYTEDYRHDTWGNVVQNRVELVSLLDKLKDEKLYKQEVEKLKVLEADVQDQNEVVDAIAEMEKIQEEKAEVFNTDYKCEVCKLELGTKIALMEHYSGGHMLVKLKEKFKHLVVKGQCKICKFEAENDNLMWIHIGALHGKVNSVLKENKLKPIGDKVKDCNDEKTNPEISENPLPKVDPIIMKEDNSVINKLEKKIEELKYEMIESKMDNQPMTDLSAGSRVQNNQESEEVLSMMEGAEIRKVNSILNLDGMTELEEDEVKPDASKQITNDEQTEENGDIPKTTKGKKGKNVKEKATEEDTGVKGKRGRKRKADTQTVPISEEDNKSIEIKVEGIDKSTENKSKVNVSQKQKDADGKANDESNDSVERPRRGRACKEIAEVIKVANTPIKKAKEKKLEPDDSKKSEGKGSKEKKTVKELKEEINEKDIKEGTTENNLKEEKNEKNKRGRAKKEENKKDGNKKEENKKDGNKKEENKKDANKKLGNKKGDSKKEENVKDEDIDAQNPDESIDPKMIKDEKNEKKKRGRTATPKKGKIPIIDATTDVKIQEDVKVEEVKTEDTKDVKNQNKKRRSPVKKASKAPPAENQGKEDTETMINSTQVENVAQEKDLKEENNIIEKTTKGSQSKKATPKKNQKETINKKNKKNEESTENEDKHDMKTETKTQGKRKETGDETEKQTKKKKIEEPIQTSKNVRERKSRNVRKPMYEASDEIDDEDFIPVEDIQAEKSIKAPKENKGKNNKKSNEGGTENTKIEDDKGSKTKIKKPRQRKGKEDKKVIDVAKEMKVKKRRENKLSCKKCNQWKDGKESVFACSNCEQGWHQHCAIPPLYHEPEPDWLCPLCHHVALVKKLEKTLAEFDILMERAEERRLADLIENQSRVTDDQYDDLNDYSYNGEKVLINVQVNPPQIRDIMRPDYYESSDEDAPESDDDEWGVKRTAACTCEGDGDCLYCKRMQGCSCDGHGTCRLCMAKSEKAGSKPGAPKGPTKMSTTEMFMLTGKTRQVEVQAHEHRPDDGFRYRGTTRGRFMPRRMRRGRGGRGTGMGRPQPPMTSGIPMTPTTPTTPSIGKNLPPGITITSTPAEKKPFAGLGIGRSLPPGITVMDSSGKDISHLTPKARAPVPQLNLPGISISRGNEPPAKVIDVIDLSDSDDEPEILALPAPSSMSLVPYRPPRPMQSRPYGAGQGGPRVPNQLGGSMQMQRRPMPPGMRRPMQQGGMMRPRMPPQQGGRIIVQSGQRPRVPFQRGNMGPRRGGPPQRGAYPMQRGPGISGQRGAYPAQRRPIPVRGGMRPMQRGGPPGQRSFGGPPRPGMPSRRPMMRRPMGRIMPGGMRPRGPMMRPPQGGMGRGMRPMMRMRGRPMPGRGGPRPIGISQHTKQPDIVIPTVTPGHDPSPDMDIVADNADIPNFDGQDDRDFGSPLPAERRGYEANLARLPQFIQIQKVFEHEVLDLE